MLHKKSEKGQALVLIALAAVGLFGFTALSIDGGMVFSDRRHAQNAADTAVLAAALARVRAPSNPDAAAVLAGEARAVSNGYANDTDSTVEVHICDEPGITCEGLPAGAYTINTVPEVESEYIQVKITSIVRTTFARIVGRTTVTNIVTAVAHAKVGGPSPLFDGAALVALAPGGSPTIRNQGNIDLDIINSGIFDNSTDGCAFTIGGNSTVNVDTGYTIATNGTANPPCLNGSPQGNVTDPNLHQSGTQIPYPPDLAIPIPSITCSGSGSVDHASGTVFPGNFGSENFNNGSYTFMPGSYCFNGDLKIGGNAEVTANYVDILFTSGKLSVTSTLNCDYILVHISGGSGITVNGNANVVCTNATFVASTGSISLEGTGANTFTAPTSGPHQEYANLLIYMPYGNTSPLKITGNSGTEMTGSIIGVSAPVTLHGNSDFELHSSITGYTIEITGGAQTTINYIPEEQLTVLDPAALGLTK